MVLFDDASRFDEIIRYREVSGFVGLAGNLNSVRKMGLTLKYLSLLMVLLFLSFLSVSQAAEHELTEGVVIKDPGSELWRNVRQREFPLTGTSQMKSTGADVLINISGESWRQYRMAELIPKASIALFLGLFGVFVFRLLRGKMILPDGRSGIKILRFTLNQRVAHWCTAILFVVLALTGLILLLGRKFLIPVMGADSFSYIAVTAKALHDYLGPAFAVSLIFLFVLFVRDNLIAPKLDIQWIMKGGGLFGGHASADRFNAGEKGWFWIAVLVGSAIIVSGLVLDFPIFGQTRETMEFYHFIHTLAATIMIIASFGHIYLGTIGTEASFEVMRTGYCDSNWAREHHDIWYEKVKDSGGESSQKAQTDSDTDGGQTESTDTA
jgi:formate dehydrogenase subunit gamma